MLATEAERSPGSRYASSTNLTIPPVRRSRRTSRRNSISFGGSTFFSRRESASSPCPALLHGFLFHPRQPKRRAIYTRKLSSERDFWKPTRNLLSSSVSCSQTWLLRRFLITPMALRAGLFTLSNSPTAPRSKVSQEKRKRAGGLWAIPLRSETDRRERAKVVPKH